MIVLNKLNIRWQKYDITPDEDPVYSNVFDALMINRQTATVQQGDYVLFLAQHKIETPQRDVLGIDEAHEIYKILTPTGIIGYIWANPSFWEPVQK